MPPPPTGDLAAATLRCRGRQSPNIRASPILPLPFLFYSADILCGGRHLASGRYARLGVSSSRACGAAAWASSGFPRLYGSPRCFALLIPMLVDA